MCIKYLDSFIDPDLEFSEAGISFYDKYIRQPLQPKPVKYFILPDPASEDILKLYLDVNAPLSFHIEVNGLPVEKVEDIFDASIPALLQWRFVINNDNNRGQ